MNREGVGENLYRNKMQWLFCFNEKYKKKNIFLDFMYKNIILQARLQ